MLKKQMSVDFKEKFGLVGKKEIKEKKMNEMNEKLKLDLSKMYQEKLN